MGCPPTCCGRAPRGTALLPEREPRWHPTGQEQQQGGHRMTGPSKCCLTGSAVRWWEMCKSRGRTQPIQGCPQRSHNLKSYMYSFWHYKGSAEVTVRGSTFALQRIRDIFQHLSHNKSTFLDACVSLCFPSSSKPKLGLKTFHPPGRYFLPTEELD